LINLERHDIINTLRVLPTRTFLFRGEKFAVHSKAAFPIDTPSSLVGIWQVAVRVRLHVLATVGERSLQCLFAYQVETCCGVPTNVTCLTIRRVTCEWTISMTEYIELVKYTSRGNSTIGVFFVRRTIIGAFVNAAQDNYKIRQCAVSTELREFNYVHCL
jgi:hypothetical protein